MKAKIIIIFILLSVAMFMQDSSSDEPEKATLWGLIRAAGLVGYVIIICSIAGIALSIDALVSLKMNKLAPPYLVQELDRLLENQEFDEAIQLCDNNSGFLGNVMSAALSRLGYGYDEMKRAMEESLDIESFKLVVKISYISLLGQITPLLGLLGTVTGMINSFRDMAVLPVITPKELAPGVYEALVTTAQGLIVAIPLLAVHFALKNKVEKLTLGIATITNAFLEKTKTFLEQE